MKEDIIRIAELITIEYANLSGRETSNRAEFRDRVIKILEDIENPWTNLPDKDKRKIIKGAVKKSNEEQKRIVEHFQKRYGEVIKRLAKT